MKRNVSITLSFKINLFNFKITLSFFNYYTLFFDSFLQVTRVDSSSLNFFVFLFKLFCPTNLLNSFLFHLFSFLTPFESKIEFKPLLFTLFQLDVTCLVKAKLTLVYVLTGPFQFTCTHSQLLPFIIFFLVTFFVWSLFLESRSIELTFSCFFFLSSQTTFTLVSLPFVFFSFRRFTFTFLFLFIKYCNLVYICLIESHSIDSFRYSFSSFLFSFCFFHPSCSHRHLFFTTHIRNSTFLPFSLSLSLFFFLFLFFFSHSFPLSFTLLLLSLFLFHSFILRFALLPQKK